MNRFGIRKISSVTLLTISFAFVNLSTSTPLQATPVEECSKELLLSFFPEEFVLQVLQKYQVSQEKWDPIVKGLKDKNDEVLKLIDEQASKMDPNPLKDPSQKQVAVKIFRESLLQVFSGVLMANGITDNQKIQSMLGDIQQLKTKRFAQCIESQKSSTAPSGVVPTPAPVPAPASAPAAPAPTFDGKLVGNDKDADHKDHGHGDEGHDEGHDEHSSSVASSTP